MKNLIPHFIYDNYIQGNFSGEFEAVTMFIDISGFTSMTESLMKNGKEGAEILTDIINKIFTPSIDIIYKNNGFISTFAGDAYTSIFPLTKFKINNTEQTAKEIRNSFKKISLHKTKFGDYRLNVKIGISSGQVEWRIIQTETMNHYYFKGEAIGNAADCEKYCEIDEIVLDKTLRSRLKFPDKKFKSNFENISKPQDLVFESQEIIDESMINKDILQKFVPLSILDLDTSGEFRYVITCFISFEEKKDFDQDIRKIMELAPRYGGYFNKIDFGDKGYVALVLFGAPVAQEKMFIRSCDFAKAVTQIPDFNCRIGLSEGIAFAGFIGSKRRGEYTALGMSVNKAARLMMNATWKDIYLDENIFKTIEKNYEVNFVRKIPLKGFNIPVATYKLIKKKTKYELFFSGDFFDRNTELEQLQKILDKPANEFGGLHYIDSVAGVGKSRLIFEFINNNLVSKQWIYMVCDDILCKSFNPVKYFLFKFFNQSDENTQLENIENFNTKFTEIYNSIKENELAEEFLRTKSFLSAFINLFWAGSLYEKLDAKSRYENMLFSFKNLIKALCLIKPVAIVIEDANSIDPDSINILETLLRNVEKCSLTVFVVCRLNDDYSQFNLPFKSYRQSRITLESFPKNIAREFVQNRFLQNRAVDKKIPLKTFNLIWEKSEGNPFFIEQTILYIKDKKLVNEDYNLIKSDFDIPADINSLIVSRIDKLETNLKRVTKIASVLGKKFTNRVLSAIVNEQEIEKYIIDGIEENLWYSLSKVDNMFKNAFIRESVYQLILKKELRYFHKLAGQSIEKLYKDDLKEYFADLAYNYQQAEMKDKTLFYLEKAGNYAKDMYQIQASLCFFYNLLNVLDNFKNNSEYLELRQRTKLNIVELLLIQGNTENAKKELAYFEGENISNIKEKDKYYFLQAQILSIKENYLELKEYCLNTFDKISTDYYKYYLKIYYLDTLRFLNEQQIFEEKALSFQKELQNKKDPFFESRLANIRGLFYLYQANYTKAMEYFQYNYKIVKEQNDKISEKSVLNSIGAVYSRLGDKQKAMEYYMEALKIAKEIGSKHSSSKLLTNIAGIYSVEGKYDKALEYYNTALNITRSVGNKMQEGILLYNIGEVFYRQELYKKALNYLDDSKNICLEISDIVGITYANDLLGDIYYTLKKYQEARSIYYENLELQKKTRDSEGIAHTYGNLGNLEKIEKNFVKAEEYYSIQQNMLNEVGDKQGEGNAMFNWAMLEVENKNPIKAEEKLKQALRLFEDCSFTMGINLCRDQLRKLKI